MPKKSVRENKNIYQLAREEAGMTRQKASDEISFMSESVIEKIEYDQVKPAPDQVLAMAKAYKKMDLCNTYCSRECEIGINYIPEVNISGLPEITLHMLAALNSIEKEKNRLVEITVDGQVSEEELKDFARIQHMVNQLSMAAEAMKLWVEQSIASGSVDREALDALMEQYK